MPGACDGAEVALFALLLLDEEEVDEVEPSDFLEVSSILPSSAMNLHSHDGIQR